MALLESTEARTILLLAPAGYGKTTLARQWARTVSGAQFLKLSSAHRDVSVLARELAAVIGDEAEDYVRAYVTARANPQREPREIAKALARQLRTTNLQWLILDDYHEIVVAPEAEDFLQALHDETQCRFVIASRTAPAWTDARLAVYGELTEINRDALAMDSDESRQVLGGASGIDQFLVRAAGWPAVIGLAAASGITELSGKHLPAALHDYLTDEIYRSASEELREQLLRIALAPDLHDETLRELFGDQRQRITERATDLGFLSGSEGSVELHPLFREYLLQKLATEGAPDEMIDGAIAAAARRERWNWAFQLVLRFDRFSLVEPLLEQAYAPLLRSGRFGTLSSFASSVRSWPALPPPVIDLVEAEVALRDGAFQQASRIAQRVANQLPVGHPLIARAQTIVGQSAFVQAELTLAGSSYRKAFEAAKTDEDAAEALRGWALSSIQGEIGDAALPLEELAARQHGSPMDLLRYANVSLVAHRFKKGLAERPPEIDEGIRAAEGVPDPRATSSFAYSVAYVLGLRAEYDEAIRMMDTADEIIASYDLDFARPYADWNRAWLSIGHRRFGNAERLLQRMEDRLAVRPLDFHILNCRILRARIAMQTGRASEAVQRLPMSRRERVIPSIYAEYLATRALAFALAGDALECAALADEADRTTKAVEVRVLSAAARVVAHAEGRLSPADLWRLAEELGAYDPMLAALRASNELADRLAECQDLRPGLASLYERSNDIGLARRAGLRVRSTRSPEDLLTPRELEVLGMLAQGLRNRDIATALVVSQSTIKVHVRHIFEKLGVRTRAEAVARFGLMR